MFWNFNEAYKDKIALIDADLKIKLTYSLLFEKVERVAEALRFDDKRLIFQFCENSFQSIVYYLASIVSGNAVLLLDSKINEDLRSQLIDIYKPELILDNSSENYDGFSKINIDSELFFFKTQKENNTPINTDLAVLLSTSGTTGSPKLVRLAYKNIQANASSIAEYLTIESDERAITSLPMNYSFGLSVINSHLLKGATIVLTNKSFVFKDFWNVFAENECTSFAGVPHSYELLKKTNFHKQELHSLRYLTQAGGRLGNNLISFYNELAKEKRFKFFVMYGQTEATARISYVPFEKLDNKIGSIGISIPRGTIKIFLDGQEIVKPNEVGELVYSGDNVMLGYATTRSCLSKPDELNGRLATGDLGYFDEDGFFYVTGRLKRFIKIFGLRLNLDEVEKMLEDSFKIFNACTGDDEGLVVLIQTEDEHLNYQVHQKVSEYYKIHKSAIHVKNSHKVPVTESGKKDYKAVKEFFIKPI